VANYLPGIFAMIVLAAGWHYAFFSSAAMKLAAVENPRLNARRVLMRRINGAVMFLLAVDFYILCYAETSATVGAILVLALFALMMLLLLFALADLRLTRQLRDDLKKRNS
jgi:hypothetical protein